jgi:hypothetical protein
MDESTTIVAWLTKRGFDAPLPAIAVPTKLAMATWLTTTGPITTTHRRQWRLSLSFCFLEYSCVRLDFGSNATIPRERSAMRLSKCDPRIAHPHECHAPSTRPRNNSSTRSQDLVNS